MKLIDSIGFRIASKWIAGLTISDVVEESKRVNSSGELVMINYLGEAITSKGQIKKERRVYEALLLRMKQSGVRGCIAIKPTQLGLSLDYGLFLSNYVRIAKAARRLGIFVWMDMEEPNYVSNTIKAYLSALRDYDNLGICMQARLLRSFKDVKAIVGRGGTIRLVKGAYGSIKGVNYPDSSGVDSNYVRCMEYLFVHSKRFMIATHDHRIISKALEFEKRYKKKAMFAMLRGIRPNLAMELAHGNEEMYIYMPFGEQWMQYSVRRLKELGNLKLILRSIFQG